MDIKIHDIIRSAHRDCLLQGLHRVLWLRKTNSSDGDMAIVIEIKTPDTNGKLSRYWRGPREVRVIDLLDAISEGKATILLHCAPPPLAHLSDDEIRRIYPKRTSVTIKRARTDCSAIQTRDRLRSVIEPIVRFIESDPETAYKYDNLRHQINSRIKETGRPKPECLDALHRYLALGCGWNALLPNTAKCGGRGRTRKLKNSSRLGRKNAAYKAGLIAVPGIHLTEHDRLCINFGWNTYLSDKASVRAAYILTLGTYWASGLKIDSGRQVPVLLPPEQRPTIKQFRYWGPKQVDGKAASHLLLRPNEYEKKYRPTLGSALDGVRAIGQLGIMDSTSTDQTLVSMLSPLDAVGTCIRNVIHDGLSDMICGLYCGFEAPSGLTVLLTILNAASDKVEFCRRFGISITPEQFPSIFFATLRVDNGEARSEKVIDQARNIGVNIEFVKADAPDRKSAPESGHRVIHRLLDRRGDGRTNGRQRARGEKHSAVHASWTWYVYTRELIRGIIYYNCYADASALMSRHPFRTEMARDKVSPTRAAIYAWCIKNNRIASPPCNIELLRASVLPTIKAVVTRKGVQLLRPDKGRKREIITGARFASQYSIDQGWHEGTASTRDIEVRYDPNDLSCIWYSDRLGFHRLENRSTDEYIKREGTLRDYLDVQDRCAMTRLITQNQRDQGLSDVVTHIENTNLTQRDKKERAKRATGRKISNRELVANMNSNREREKQYISSQIDPISRMPSNIEERPTEPGAAGQAAPEPLASPSYQDDVQSSLARHRRRNVK